MIIHSDNELKHFQVRSCVKVCARVSVCLCVCVHAALHDTDQSSFSRGLWISQMIGSAVVTSYYIVLYSIVLHPIVFCVLYYTVFNKLQTQWTCNYANC